MSTLTILLVGGTAVGISVKRSRGKARLRVSGAASVRIVGEVRGILLALLEEGRHVDLDLTDAQSADIAFLQLVVSARRSFDSLGRRLEIVDGGGALDRVVPGAARVARLTASGSA
jgi:hypothetical protein